MWIVNAAQSREMDRRAIEEFGVPTDALMERAGNAVFEAIADRFPAGTAIVFVCGKGNNGGDALVAARLAKVAGYDVTCFIMADAGDLTENCRRERVRAEQVGISVVPWDNPEFVEFQSDISLASVIVDGILGTGLTSQVDRRLAVIVRMINEAEAFVVAIDVPTGLDASTGDLVGPAIIADLTVTMSLPKTGLFIGAGPDCVGETIVATLGFPESLFAEHGDAFLLSPDDLWLRLPERPLSSHKGTSGSLLIVAGSEQMPGAAVLAARGAIRAGVGLVTVAAVPNVCATVTHHLPEAILLPLTGDPHDRAAHILQSNRSFDAAVFGPGLGTGTEVRQFLETLWQDWKIPSVIDADALNLISAGLQLPQGECVLTPHPGEMGRLLSMSALELQSNRFKAATAAAEQFKAIVVLKGRHTVIAQGSLPVRVNPTGNPGMATGGMGDVLSGVLGAFIAQGTPPLLAAELAVYLHGAAGDYCAATIGEVGFTASEVADATPIVRAKLAAWPD